ncbi:hypothetical protein [Aurantimonas endophytica]|uniref:Uncharacterized protein n=1 Tax=Aurantimonas endophytica TaxID=1522175 RepID=A0A7W6MN69_9HYPH|nr:hypothetical protein [Aurantimonas endophytica]MBB4001595.1 hypothetical protein [Aurantimonas endophytica]
MIDGRARKAKQEQEGRAWQAWTTAALYRSKKFPKLKDIMPSDKPKRPQKMLPEQIEEVVRSWLSGRRNR